MRIRNLIGPALCLAALALSGCGGGDSPGATDGISGINDSASKTVITGLASKGPINGGTVKVFAIRDGVVDTSVPIGQGTTNAGNFNIDCGGFKGAVMVEVTGGTFTDEVSGATVTLKSPMHAVFANASTGKKNVAVTPLTELATRRAKGHTKLSDDVINESNASVATTFNLPDIVATLPDSASTDDNKKKYAAACGSFSQLANNRHKSSGQSLDDDLKGVMDDMGNEVEHNGGLSDDSITKINDAVTEFNSGKNKGGTIAPPVTPTNGTLKISTSGPSGIGALDMTIDLPAGTTVAADAATGETAAGVVTISGVAANGSNKLIAAKFTPATSGIYGKLKISMVNSTGFGPGECVTVDFHVATGGSFPAAASAFAVSGVSAKDLNSNLLSGVTVAPASMGAL